MSDCIYYGCIDESIKTPEPVKPLNRQVKPLFARFGKTEVALPTKPVRDEIYENIVYDNNDIGIGNIDDNESPFIDNMSYTSSTPLPARASVPPLEHSPITAHLDEPASPALSNIHDEAKGKYLYYYYYYNKM
jgi:hypothetical protein